VRTTPPPHHHHTAQRSTVRCTWMVAARMIQFHYINVLCGAY
jgi:hypothetical protein